MIKFNLPKTTLKNYQDYHFDITFAFSRGIRLGKSLENINRMQEKINENYYGKIFPQDFYEFDCLNDLEKFLYSVDVLDEDLIKSSISHESEHKKKAEELGYLIQNYFAVLLMNEEKITFAAAIKILIPKEHLSQKDTYNKLKEVYLSPGNPSLTDLIF